MRDLKWRFNAVQLVRRFKTVLSEKVQKAWQPGQRTRRHRACRTKPGFEHHGAHNSARSNISDYRCSKRMSVKNNLFRANSLLAHHKVDSSITVCVKVRFVGSNSIAPPVADCSLRTFAWNRL